MEAETPHPCPRSNQGLQCQLWGVTGGAPPSWLSNAAFTHPLLKKQTKQTLFLDYLILKPLVRLRVRRTGPGWPRRLLEGGLGRWETPPPGLLQGRPPRPARSGQHTAPTAPPPGSAWAAEPPHPRLTSPAGCLGPDAGHPDSLSSLQGSPWDRRSPTGQPPELTPPLAQCCVLPAPPTGAGHQHTSCTPTSASAAAPKTLLEEGIPDRKWPQRVTAACPASPGPQTLAAKGDPRARLASPSAPEAQASQALPSEGVTWPGQPKEGPAGRSQRTWVERTEQS